MNLPDYVIGLGGAGREMAKTFLTEEWIMEHAVTQNDSLNAHFIDSDTNIDLKEDVEAIENVRDEVHDYNYNAGVNAHSIHLVDDLNERPTGHLLLSSGPIQDMGIQGEIDAWWLEDDPDLIRNGFGDGVVRKRGLSKALYHFARSDDNDPFNEFEPQGGKAALMVGLGGGTGSGTLIDIAQKLSANNVSVNLFAVLPGSSPDLPHELANAYAALSEIEKLALDGENPFKSVILIPEEPYHTYAEFDRAIMYTVAGYYNTAQSVDNVDERMNEDVGGAPGFAPFTIAVPQVITYPGGQIDTKRQSFKEYIGERESVLEDEKEVIEQIETFIISNYNDIQGGLLNEAGDSDSPLSTELVGERGLYEGRFVSLVELLQSDFVSQAGYRTDSEDGTETMTDEWLNAADQFDGDTHDEMATTLEDLADSDFNDHDGNDETEVRLNRFVELQTENLGKRTALLKTIKDISDPLVAKELNTALSYDKGKIRSDASDIEDLLAQFKRTTNQEVIPNVEDVHTDAEGERDELVKDWRNNVMPNQVSHMPTLDDLYRETARLLSDLDTALGRFRDNALHWREPANVTDTQLNFDGRDFDTLSKNLESLNISPIESEIKRSVEGLKEAGREATKSGGLIKDGADRQSYKNKTGPIHNGVFNPPNFDQAVDDTRNFDVTYQSDLIEEVQNKLINRIKHGIPETEVLESKQKELFDRIDEEIKQFDSQIDDLKNKLRNYVDDKTISSELAAIGLDRNHGPSTINRSEEDVDTQALEEEISSIVDQIETDIKGGYSSNTETLPSDLRSELDERLTEALVDPIEGVETKLDNFESEIDQKETIFSELDDVARSGSSFTSSWSGVVDLEDIFDEENVTVDNNVGQYIHEIEPADNSRLNKETIAESGIWGQTEEKEILKNAFYEKFHGALDSSEFLPLEETNIQPENKGIFDEKTSYKEYTVTVTYLSRVFDRDDIVSPQNYDEFEVSPRLNATDRTMIPMNNNDPRAAACPYAAAWDFAGVAFVGRVFLDNISPVRSNYSSTYDEITGRQIEITGRDHLDGDSYIDSSVIRHTLGIDGQTDDVPDGFDGVFYRRKKFIQFGRDDSLANLLDLTVEDAPGEDHDKYWDRVQAKLREDFVERNGFFSTQRVTPDDE